MVFCTFANAGRRLAIGNPVGDAGVPVVAWPRAASDPIQAPLTTSRVKTASLDDRGVRIILSPDDNGAGAVATCGGFDGLGMLRQNKGCRRLCGPVAQLGARFHGMEEVTGSIPVRSTNQTNNLDRPEVPGSPDVSVSACRSSDWPANHRVLRVRLACVGAQSLTLSSLGSPGLPVGNCGEAVCVEG
jgi:hypothetical protein